jgi:hypothetical protein
MGNPLDKVEIIFFRLKLDKKFPIKKHYMNHLCYPRGNFPKIKKKTLMGSHGIKVWPYKELG